MEIKIIGVPTDFGANRIGVDLGPAAIRYARLFDTLTDMGLEVEDLGDIGFHLIENEPKSDDKKYELQVLQVTDVCEDLALMVNRAANRYQIPVILGGDHSVTIGILGGMAKVKKMGLIYFDAHGDFNTSKTTLSYNIHGMGLAAVVGRGSPYLVNCVGVTPKVKEENVVLVGARDLDPVEKELLRESMVTVFTMDDIDRLGIRQVMEQSIDISSKGTEGVHISIDMDFVNPQEAPGVGTPVKGGLTYREAHLALEMIAEADILASLDVMEVNPILDCHNQTAELAVELIASALGKRIL
ncbi:arginase [Methanococcoides methylutens]|uniref:arginase n=1 Tax=Methanococcoides methylutens TaxID=2226 RepID=UPI0040448573